MESICYITTFYDIGRDKWKSTYKRSFKDYMKEFEPYFDLFSNPLDKEQEMILFLDAKFCASFRELLPPTARIRVIEIDETFMSKLHIWKTLPIEREIMSSFFFKHFIPERLEYPECSKPEYTLINHCKINFINYVIDNNLSDASYYCWVDFGYFKSPFTIPKRLLDVNKLNRYTINYSTIERIDIRDSNVYYTLKVAPEKIGGFFFFGSKEKMKEYQELYHSCLEDFHRLGIADDDQALALFCFWKRPALFTLYHLGNWHLALLYFQKI